MQNTEDVFHHYQPIIKPSSGERVDKHVIVAFVVGMIWGIALFAVGVGLTASAAP